MTREEFFTWFAERQEKQLIERQAIKDKMIQRLEDQAKGTVWIEDNED